MENEKKIFNIVVCASGGGGNFQVLIDNQINFSYQIILLICDKYCGAVDRAIKSNITYYVIDKKLEKENIFNSIDNIIPLDTNLIVLAGFMPIIPAFFCKKWNKKIINTHPSLLPKYGGKGMYGVRVQESVMSNKEEFAGCTIHYVNEGVDEGEIILQKKIKVNYSETPWELGGRIFKEEGPLLLKAINLIKGDNCV